MSDLDETLDAIEAKYALDEPSEVPVVEEEVVDVEPEGSPPGHMSLDEWTAAGKDPDYYKGKKAYVEEYDRLQEKISLENELKPLKTQLKQVKESMDDWQTHQTAQIKADLESQLAQATEDENVTAALEAQKKIDALPEEKQEPVENPIIVQFRTDNPILDSDSPEYNKDFDSAVENLFNTKGQALGFQRSIYFLNPKINELFR